MASKSTRSKLQAIIDNPDSSPSQILTAARLLKARRRKCAPRGKPFQPKAKPAALEETQAQQPQSSKPFSWTRFFEEVGLESYDGPRGELLRKYHASKASCEDEFHKAGKHTSETEALWGEMVAAYKEAFGEERNGAFDALQSIRRFAEREEEEKLRKNRPTPINPSVRVA